MPGLLVSVRSAAEARAAVEGGATVVDVKEPDLGPLGRAPVPVWRAVRAVVPASTPVSVALGELRDLDPGETWPPDPFAGIAFRKVGLAGAGPGWSEDWAEARRVGPAGPRWVAVIYADWERAGAPGPDAVIDRAVAAEDCAGVLVDTWDKARPSPLGVSATWSDRIDRVRRSGRFVALAGGLDRDALARLAPLEPDLFAVRGAACVGSDRRAPVDPGRVAALVRAIAADGRRTVPGEGTDQACRVRRPSFIHARSIERTQ